MGRDERGYSVDGIHLLSRDGEPARRRRRTFEEIAEEARRGCAISKALRVPITLDAKLTA